MPGIEIKEDGKQPSDKKQIKSSKTKIADPHKASRDVATQTMIKRAQELGIDTVFDRAVQMKPCKRIFSPRSLFQPNILAA